LFVPRARKGGRGEKEGKREVTNEKRSTTEQMTPVFVLFGKERAEEEEEEDRDGKNK
jgi:hypothetical protein